MPHGTVYQLNNSGGISLTTSPFFWAATSHYPLHFAYLGDISNINLNNTFSRILSIALTITKKTILMNWKSRNKINITIWKNLLIEYISMVFDIIWNPFISSLNS